MSAPKKVDARAYTPGLICADNVHIHKTRELPLNGENLVDVGAEVTALQPVLRASVPGELYILRIAERMGFDALDLKGKLRVKVGDKIERGQLLCEVRSFFGLFPARFESPVAGTVEFYTEALAHLGVRAEPMPIEVAAFINGTVTEVQAGKSVTIDACVGMLQGIFGVGGERFGEIFALDVPADTIVGAANLNQLDLKNKIIIGGAQFDISALKAAAEAGAIGVVTGSIDADTLHEFVGHEIGVSITGDEDVPLTLFVTEGFGKLSLSARAVEWAKRHHENPASITGATQVRAGALRPELIVSRPELVSCLGTPEDLPTLQVGAKARMIRVPYFGQIGTITELPTEPELIPTGAKVRVLRVKLDDGKVVTVPRANVELV